MALARKLGRSALGRSVQVLLDAMEATKPIYMKADDGEGNTAFIPGPEVPDHAIRIRAAAELQDRFGLPRKVETDGTDAFAAFLVAVQERALVRAQERARDAEEAIKVLEEAAQPQGERGADGL